MTNVHKFSPPAIARQVGFHQLLLGARNLWLVDALQLTLKEIDPDTLQKELKRYAPKSARQILASAGVREEQVFPTPVVLRHKPTLVGYYRLLYGSSQKEFYRSTTGFARFKSMETKGIFNAWQSENLDSFCRAMAGPLAELITSLSPTVTIRDVNELRLLTLGSQFQGARSVIVGKEATAEVLLAITEIVQSYIIDQNERTLYVRNPAGRTYIITFGSDPDVTIDEVLPDKSSRRKLAIEIKGGMDPSNAHNRAGEAEKSHQKAKKKDYLECWTLILMKGFSKEAFRNESPTTNVWFDVAEVLAREGNDWQSFKDRLAETINLPRPAM